MIPTGGTSQAGLEYVNGGSVNYDNTCAYRHYHSLLLVVIRVHHRQTLAEGLTGTSIAEER